jgi:putative addiction module component (TIGR02574 family)
MSKELAIKNLSIAEKLALMESLWDDLSQKPENIPSPDWHGNLLTERIKAVKEGRTSFIEWDEAKKRLREHVE